ncbi:archease [Candidatus Bathyarchaeota archaeon]|nr:archease [Candidatus Bathyarchaeota archaeon]
MSAGYGGKRFEFLEHTADVYIAAYGGDLCKAFENAALAMFETMTDTVDVRREREDIVEVEGEDLESLLYNWLENLLVKFEVENMLYSEFNVLSIERYDGKLRLKAKIYGEPFDPERHKQKVGIKAVTYHRMEVNETSEGITLKFILDI